MGEIDKSVYSEGSFRLSGSERRATASGGDRQPRIAVILAAGVGSRLGEITADRPKCLVSVAGMPILERQLRSLFAAGIDHVYVVVGYRAKAIESWVGQSAWAEDVTLIANCDFIATNNMYSLHLVRNEVRGKAFVLINGDVCSDPEILRSLMSDARGDLIAVDKSQYLAESMKVTCDTEGFLRGISKELTQSEALGVSIDLYKFSSRSSNHLFGIVEFIVDHLGDRSRWTEVAINELLEQPECGFEPLYVDGSNWIEIDDINDLQKADATFSTLGLNLPGIRLILMDLDGTVLRSGRVLEGAPEAIDRIRSAGVDVLFLSNNSSRAEYDYANLLEQQGIPCNESDVLLSTQTAIAYLFDHSVTRVWVLGTKALRARVSDAGFLIDDTHPDVVLVGFDTEVTFEKLATACRLIAAGISYVLTHPDRMCPGESGPLPDAGAMSALLQAATGIAPRATLGKPDPIMVRTACHQRGVEDVREVAVIGDRLYTDIRLAHDSGAWSVLVLSGETKRVDLEIGVVQRPDLVVSSLSDLMPARIIARQVARD